MHVQQRANAGSRENAHREKNRSAIPVSERTLHLDNGSPGAPLGRQEHPDDGWKHPGNKKRAGVYSFVTVIFLYSESRMNRWIVQVSHSPRGVWKTHLVIGSWSASSQKEFLTFLMPKPAE